MKRNKYKFTTIVLATSMLACNMTACAPLSNILHRNGDKVASVFIGDGIREQQFAKLQEVKDYYAEAIKYNQVSTRPAVDAALIQAEYNTVDQGSKTYVKLKDALNNVRLEHNKVYDYTIPTGLHDYIKSFTDDLALTDAAIVRAKEFGGYYYLTVKYKTQKNNHGSFKNQANYMGIDGVIVYDQNGQEYIDTQYLDAVITKMNPVLEAAGKPTLINFENDELTKYNPQATYTGEDRVNNSTEDILTSGVPLDVPDTPADPDLPGDPAVTGESVPESEAASVENTETSETQSETAGEMNVAAENIEETTQATESSYIPEDTTSTNVAALEATYTDRFGNFVDKVGVNNIDRLTWNPTLINDTVGTVNKQIPFIPSINMVYNPAGTLGELNGFGMYDQGKAGLQDFGFVKGDEQGDIVITYVFKQDIRIPDRLEYVFSYVNDYNSNNKSIHDAKSKFGGVITEFVDEARAKKVSDGNVLPEEVDIERIKAEFTGPQITVPTFLKDKLVNIVDEVDRAVNDKNVQVLMDGTVIEDVGLGMKYAAYTKSADITSFQSNIQRIVARHGNEYLLEVERSVIDAPKDTGVAGEYRDTYFVVVRQEGTDFRYNDEYLVRRVTASVPVVNPEDTSIRRLITLNLSGAVDANTAKNITDQVFNRFTENMNTKNIDYQDVFNKDENLLSSDRRAYLISKVASQAMAMGENSKWTWTVKPSNWIAGSDNQAELTTREFISYNDNKDGGLYIENYYLVSKYGTEWKIDDIITTTSQRILDRADADSYLNKVNSTNAEFSAAKKEN